MSDPSPLNAREQADFQLYIGLMEEEKVRFYVLENVLRGSTGLPPRGVRESCFLQLRMLCEVIAFACITANGNIKEKGLSPLLPLTKYHKARSWDLRRRRQHSMADQGEEFCGGAAGRTNYACGSDPNPHIQEKYFSTIGAYSSASAEQPPDSVLKYHRRAPRILGQSTVQPDAIPWSIRARIIVSSAPKSPG